MKLHDRGVLIGIFGGDESHEQKRGVDANDGCPTTAKLKHSGERVEAGNRDAVGLQGDGRIDTRDVIPIHNGSWSKGEVIGTFITPNPESD